MNSAVEPSGDQAQRRRWRLTRRFWVVVAAVFGAYMAFSYVTGFVQIAKIKHEISRVQAEIQAVETLNEELRRELTYLQSDEYIEKVAREELGLVKPGETAVKVNNSTGQDAEEDGGRSD